MNQQPMSVKIALPQNLGVPGYQNALQTFRSGDGVAGPIIFQPNTPRYSAIPIQSLGNSSVQMNTNTALQYARPPQEVTIVGPSGTFMTSPLAQPFGSILSMNQNNFQGMQNNQNMLGPIAGLASMPNQQNSLINSKKSCNCTKSHCLKLYCECFSQGQLCQNCNCNNCMNNLAYEDERGRAIKMTLDRNPMAFRPKIGRGEGERKHTKGCNCKRSGCLKNYCECYEAKISCTDLCHCQGCRNTEDSIERRSLMRLVTMGSLRSRKSDYFEKHLAKPRDETLPHVFFTWETIEATARCLLAQAEEAERRDLPQSAQERIILEEFCRTVDNVIDAASKAQINPTSASLLPESGCCGKMDSDLLPIASGRDPFSSDRAVAANHHLDDDDDEDTDMMSDLENSDSDRMLDFEDGNNRLRKQFSRHRPLHHDDEKLGVSGFSSRNNLPRNLSQNVSETELTDDIDSSRTKHNSLHKSYMPPVKFITRGRHQNRFVSPSDRKAARGTSSAQSQYK